MLGLLRRGVWAMGKGWAEVAMASKRGQLSTVVVLPYSVPMYERRWAVSCWRRLLDLVVSEPLAPFHGLDGVV